MTDKEQSGYFVGRCSDRCDGVCQGENQAQEAIIGKSSSFFGQHDTRRRADAFQWKSSLRKYGAWQPLSYG
ncbi:MAG: hypothetical protein QF473_13960 [Planctomycetota bacterium]|nr:hypothetical protein [Planctomycetota bacterium]